MKLIPVCLHHIGRQRNNRGHYPHTSQQTGRLDPIHHRHLHIHEDQVKRTLQGGSNRLFTVIGKGKFNPQLLQHTANQDLQHRRIPSTLETSMVPSMISARVLEI